MNKETIMRLLLVAVLCFSQLAAQVHVVSHFQLEQHVELSCESASRDAACLFAEFAHHKAHQGEHPAHPETHTTHPDCAIYHSYLSLSSCLSSISTIAIVRNQAISQALLNVSHAHRLATRNQAIRAPPVIS